MVRILGKHGNFNRVEFGSALWSSVLRPAIAHGCSIWIPSSETQRDLLQSLQYRAAKITLRTKMNVPISALLMELGWEPINNFLDRQRISYFSRFSRLPTTRLCKQVYDKMFGTNVKEWPYFTYIKNLFEIVGLDHFLSGNCDRNTFNKFFGQINRIKAFENINSKSSLDVYKTFNISQGCQKYLINLNEFEGSRLKLLARTNCLPINSVLYRMQLCPSPCCTMCNNNVDENVHHILLDCPAYNHARQVLYKHK